MKKKNARTTFIKLMKFLACYIQVHKKMHIWWAFSFFSDVSADAHQNLMHEKK
jgi:hypothetical protein